LSSSLYSRARAYVSRLDPAIEGSGGHDATFKVACALVKGFGFSPEEALPLMEEYNASCMPPWPRRDLEHKLRSAQAAPDKRTRGYLAEASSGPREDDGVRAAPRADEVRMRYDAAKLVSFANGCRQNIDRVWLAERSPMRVEWGNRPGLAVDVLSFLFGREDLVLLFKRQWSQGDFGVWRGAGWRLSRERGVSAVRSEIPTESNAGLLLMAAPVDGRWRIVSGAKGRDGLPKWSRRNGACVTSFPYLVLESDEAPLDLWLRALSLLELRIAAIFSSGGRSVHTLVRVDARSKGEFDECARLVAGVLTAMGADAQAMKGLPMSRCPGVMRSETGRVQELWYLDADPGWSRLIDRRRLRSVEDGTILTRTGGG
jgi:hypothetical protein